MIGIVGGAGPTAGLDLFRKIIEETVANADQQHVPVILWSVPSSIPDRTEYLEGRVKENPAIPISKVFLKLEKAGATIAAIPCNTAHAAPIMERIRFQLREAGSNIRIVSIIEETLKYLKNKFLPQTFIGVLSTTGTWQNKIYRSPLEEAGFGVIDSLTYEEQNSIHDAIYGRVYGIKAHSEPVTDRARNILLSGANQLINRGAKAIILGCTEIPLAITERTINGIELIDPTRILARALINYYNPEKLKQGFTGGK